MVGAGILQQQLSILAFLVRAANYFFAYGIYPTDTISAHYSERIYASLAPENLQVSRLSRRTTRASTSAGTSTWQMPRLWIFSWFATGIPLPMLSTTVNFYRAFSPSSASVFVFSFVPICLG